MNNEVILSTIKLTWNLSTGSIDFVQSTIDPDKLEEVMNEHKPDHENTYPVLTLLTQANAMMGEMLNELARTAKGL